MEAQATQVETTVAQLERQLAEAREALAAALREVDENRRLAVLGQIAGGIAHELRDPLNSLAMLIHCLRQCGAGRVGSAGQYIDEMELQLVMAEQIISNLQEYARTQRPNRRPTDLNGVIEKQGDHFEIPENVIFRSQLAPALPPALVDPFHIERAFRNLVFNAIQSMGDDGGELFVATYPAEECIVVEVRDTGAGVPEEIRDKIFQPLFSTRSKGLGLGLALTRQLVEANGGSVGFRPNLERGSIFQIRLPLAG